MLKQSNYLKRLVCGAWYFTFLQLCAACGTPAATDSLINRPVPVREVQTPPSGECSAGLICPGLGVGVLRLGDSEDHAINQLGRRAFWRTSLGESPLRGGRQCPHVELNWGDTATSDEKTRNGIRAYVVSGKIQLIKADSFKLSTREGITADSTPEQIKKNFPNVTAFVLKNSASELNGPGDLIYWVDQAFGIAFELYFDRRKNRRLVGFIYVFDPSTIFYPNCRAGVLNDWIELRQYSVEDRSEAGVLH